MLAGCQVWRVQRWLKDDNNGNLGEGHIWDSFMKTLIKRKWHPTPVLLPGKSHGWRSRVGCSPWGHRRVGHNWATSLSLFTLMHWRRRWQSTPVFLPGESQGRGEPGGLPSMGSHRVRQDWSDLAIAIVSFVLQKLLNLISSHLFIFAFIPSILGGGS